MEILSLEELKNKTLADLLNPKIVRFRYVATLDTHVCDYCKSRHGMIIDANSPEYDSYMPPNHPNCRCFWQFITSVEANIPDVDWVDPSESLISDFAPFLFIIPFKGKKKDQVLDIISEESEMSQIDFKKEDVIEIPKYILISFYDSAGRFLFDTKVEIGYSLDLSPGENETIKKASYYEVDNDVEIPDDLESEIKYKYGIENRI